MRNLLSISVSLALAVSAFGAKPNIIFILADDLGYGDLGCFGQKVLKTPNIDKLAAGGMRLTRHYSGSTVCAPSRCVLMTGLHTGHCSVRGNGEAQLSPDETTMAEMLKKQGYATGCFGKWGIGNPPPNAEPNRRGFDEFYGYVNMFHAHNFYPEFLVRNGKKEKLRNVLKPEWEKFRGDRARDGAGVAIEKLDYAPDLIADEALKFIDANKAKPFFLYFALNVPHANNEGGRDGDLSRGMEVPDWYEFAGEDWPPAEKGFAAMLRNIDRDVGRVMAKLDEHGLGEKTLVVFSSDNGPHQEGRHKMEFFDSNGALRGMKRDLYDGGVRVPTIARWTEEIEAGSSSDVLSGFQDWLPTFAGLAAAEVGRTDGVSLLPTVLGEGEQVRHEFLYWEFLEKGGRIAVTDGRWKAVRLDTLKKMPKPMQLFDLDADPGEANDVAKEHPGVVEAMARRMAASHEVLE